MKKVIILVFALTLIAGCAKKETLEVSKPVGSENSAEVSEKLEGKVIEATDNSLATSDFSEISYGKYDFNADGNPDEVTLYANVKPNSSGEFMWDDFHEWILEAKFADDEYYTLFNGSVSLGQIYFEISEFYNEDVTPAITTFLTTGSSLDIEQFTYDGEAFVQNTIYSSEEASESGINRVFSSIPSYK